MSVTGIERNEKVRILSILQTRPKFILSYIGSEKHWSSEHIITVRLSQSPSDSIRLSIIFMEGSADRNNGNRLMVSLLELINGNPASPYVLMGFKRASGPSIFYLTFHKQ